MIININSKVTLFLFIRIQKTIYYPYLNKDLDISIKELYLFFKKKLLPHFFSQDLRKGARARTYLAAVKLTMSIL